MYGLLHAVAYTLLHMKQPCYTVNKAPTVMFCSFGIQTDEEEKVMDNLATDARTDEYASTSFGCPAFM